MGTMRPHGGDQRASSRRERDAALDDLIDDGNGQALEQRDPLDQGWFEFDLAAHGAFGDGGDEGLLADKISHLINAFLPDHGRIHIGDEKPLPPAFGSLHDDVDWARGEHRQQRFAEIADIDCFVRGKGDIDGNARIEPLRF